MVVVVIIGILAALATQRFSILLDKSKEGYTKAALSTLRTAISVYYADNLGKYPTDDLSSLLAGSKYLNSIPEVKIPRTAHQVTAAIALGASTAAYITDAGGWAYINDPSDRGWGQLAVNCTHQDITGEAWSGF